MLRQMEEFLRRQVRAGKLHFRVWLVAAGAVMILVAMGQAVGPLLLGLVGGGAAVTVEQAVRLTDASSVYANAGANDAQITINDEGTSFTAAFELEVGGEDNLLTLNVRNSSNQTANALLTLEFPAELELEAEAEIGTDVEETRSSGSTWLLNLTVDSDDEDLEITIRVKDDASPGFYTIRGLLVQVAG